MNLYHFKGIEFVRILMKMKSAGPGNIQVMLSSVSLDNGVALQARIGPFIIVVKVTDKMGFGSNNIYMRSCNF